MLLLNYTNCLVNYYVQIPLKPLEKIKCTKICPPVGLSTNSIHMTIHGVLRYRPTHLADDKKMWGHMRSE